MSKEIMLNMLSHKKIIDSSLVKFYEHLSITLNFNYAIYVCFHFLCLPYYSSHITKKWLISRACTIAVHAQDTMKKLKLWNSLLVLLYYKIFG